MNKISPLLLCFFTLPLYLYSEPQYDSAKEYMEGLHLFGDMNSLEMDFSMTVTGTAGTKERTMKFLMDRSDADEKLLISIMEPQFLSNMKYLSVKKGNRESQWMRTSRGIRRLSARNNSDSLFGSDFSVEDMALTDVDNFTWTFIGSDHPGETLIRAIPLYDDPAYASKVFIVESDKRLLKGIRYFDDQGGVLKEYSLLEQMTLEQIDFPEKVQMKNYENGSSTTLIIGPVIFNPSFSPGVFNKSNL